MKRRLYLNLSKKEPQAPSNFYHRHALSSTCCIFFFCTDTVVCCPQQQQSETEEAVLALQRGDRGRSAQEESEHNQFFRKQFWAGRWKKSSFFYNGNLFSLARHPALIGKIKSLLGPNLLLWGGEYQGTYTHVEGDRGREREREFVIKRGTAVDIKVFV